MEIAQSTRRIFHVRFEMENRVSVTSLSVPRESLEFNEQKWSSLLLGYRQDFRIEFFEERLITVQESSIQHRKVEFGVVLLDFLALVDGPPCGTHPKSKV